MDRRNLLSGFVALGATAAAASGLGGVVGNTLGKSVLDQNIDASLRYRTRGNVAVRWSVDTDERAVALTFDDGPDNARTPLILQILEQLEIPATFFVVGALAQRSRRLVYDLVAAGHEIGNHGYDHVDLATTTPDRVVASIVDGADAIAQVTGVRTRFFRPPNGDVTGAVLGGAQRAGNDVALWSVGRGTSAVVDDVVDVATNLLSTVHPGAFIGLHDGGGASDAPRGASIGISESTATELRALPRVVSTLIDGGWTFHTVADLVDRFSR